MRTSERHIRRKCFSLRPKVRSKYFMSSAFCLLLRAELLSAFSFPLFSLFTKLFSPFPPPRRLTLWPLWWQRLLYPAASPVMLVFAGDAKLSGTQWKGIIRHRAVIAGLRRFSFLFLWHDGVRQLRERRRILLCLWLTQVLLFLLFGTFLHLSHAVKGFFFFPLPEAQRIVVWFMGCSLFMTLWTEPLRHSLFF